MRNLEFTTGEIYHIYNRGTDGRLITLDRFDSDRFIESLLGFNSTRLCGSLFDVRKGKSEDMDSVPIVDIISYCFNPNHFHLILKQNIDQGVAKFMHRFSTGVTNHFNERYHRTGSLFQGTFKAVHVSDNDYLLHLSAYVNLNDKIHGITGRHALLVRSSWSEYKNGFLSVCNKDIIMSQFQGPSDYCDFALEQSRISIESKFDKKECAAMGVEGDDYGKKLQHRK